MHIIPLIILSITLVFSCLSLYIHNRSNNTEHSVLRLSIPTIITCCWLISSLLLNNDEHVDIYYDIHTINSSPPVQVIILNNGPIISTERSNQEKDHIEIININDRFSCFAPKGSKVKRVYASSLLSLGVRYDGVRTDTLVLDLPDNP